MDYTALAAELTAGHPDTGAYSATDSVALTQINAVNRPNDRPANSVLMYMLTKTFTTLTGTDQSYTNILGRLYHAAESSVGSSPFGQTDTMLLKQLHACKAFVAWLESPHSGSTDTASTSLPLGLVNAANVLSVAQKTDIENLSKNQISRAVELGFGENLLIGDITHARTL